MEKLSIQKSCAFSTTFQRRIICVNPTNHLQKTVKKLFAENFTIFQITFKSYRIRKNNTYMEDVDFHQLSNAILFAQFRQTIWKLSPKYDSRFRFWKKTIFSKLILNYNDSAKTFNIPEIWLSRAFQRYITRHVPTKKLQKVFELKKMMC